MILPREPEAGSSGTQPPNKRLKLAGLSFLREAELLCPDGHSISSTPRCADGPAARSLSAIR